MDCNSQAVFRSACNGHLAITMHKATQKENTKLGEVFPGRNKRKCKIPERLFRVADVVEYSSFSRQTIHNYTMMGILHEKGWTKGGHRLYGEDVFDRLDIIADFKANKKSMEFIREYFYDLDKKNNITRPRKPS